MKNESIKKPGQVAGYIILDVQPEKCKLQLW